MREGEKEKIASREGRKWGRRKKKIIFCEERQKYGSLLRKNRLERKFTEGKNTVAF